MKTCPAIPWILTPWLQSILQDSRDAVLITDASYTIIKANKAAETYCTGYPAGSNLLEVLRPAPQAGTAIEQAIACLLETGEVETSVQLTRFDGAPIELSCFIHRLAETTRFSAVVVVIRDPAASVAAPREKDALRMSLRDKVKLFQSFLNNSPSPAWIADEKGRMLFINDLARKVWQVREDYYCKHLTAIFPAEIAQRFLSSDRSVLDTGEPYIAVQEITRKDGSRVAFMLHKFLLDGPGASRLVGGQAIDITREINARNELEKINERFAYVTRVTSDSIWDWNIQTGHLYRSESFTHLTGYPLDAIGERVEWVYDHLHPDDRERVITHLNDCLSNKQTEWRDEYRFLCADNQYKHFVDKGYFFYEDGVPVRAIGAVKDITERRRLEAALMEQKVQEQKQVSKAIMATQDYERNELGKELHDNVNQMLTSASVFLDYLHDNPMPENMELLDKSRRYIREAMEAIRQVSRSLSTSFLKEIGLRESVEELLSNMRLCQPIKVQLDYDNNLARQLSSEQKIMVYRIIQEQTSNILKYAAATKVKVSIQRKHQCLHLLIKDNGKGFRPEDIGRGIGLSNIRHRVEVFNGTLRIETAPGNGCLLDVRVPVAGII